MNLRNNLSSPLKSPYCAWHYIYVAHGSPSFWLRRDAWRAAATAVSAHRSHHNVHEIKYLRCMKLHKFFIQYNTEMIYMYMNLRNNLSSPLKSPSRCMALHRCGPWVTLACPRAATTLARASRTAATLCNPHQPPRQTTALYRTTVHVVQRM